MSILMATTLFAAVGCTSSVADAPHAGERKNTPDDEISATFSIVAVDPETGEVGAAVASKYPAVGSVVPYVKAGVGAFVTQHYHVPNWGPKAIDLLGEGMSPEAVLATL